METGRGYQLNMSKVCPGGIARRLTLEMNENWVQCLEGNHKLMQVDWDGFKQRLATRIHVDSLL